MSITIQELKGDRAYAIHTALHEENVEALYYLAKLEADDGNDEVAYELLMTARRIDNQDWAYDRAIGN